MSLAALLATYDAAALKALSSKGLVLRAGKDAAAGKVAVAEQDPQTARLDVLGETVTLDGKTLDTARCSCAATGICRHILAAVLHLQSSGEAVGAAARPAPPPEFTLQQIERFAGADWPQALALAELADIPQSRGSIAVRFADMDAQVTFPNGAGLRQAIYKGNVAAHKRRLIAAAALAVAHRGGAQLPEAVVADAAKASADPAALDVIEAALEAAATALAAGTFAQTQAHLFNLAVSSRAEAIPRLSAELRGIAKRMDAGRIRQSLETPVDILCAIARSFALVQALRRAPDDPSLVGVLARSFVASGPKSVTFLGAETWATPAGAKGLTMVFTDLQTGRMHKAVHARAAGTDLSYDPRSQWQSPLWSLAKPGAMAGKAVTLPNAAVAADGGLGLTQTAQMDGAAGFGALQAIPDWEAAAQAAQDQKGVGLRQVPGDAYLVLAPSQVGAVSFDAYAQACVWDWIDARGASLPLTLPARPKLDEQLAALSRRVTGGLVALAPGRRQGRLVSVWVQGEDGPLTLEFDALPKPKGLGAMMDRLIERAAPRADSQIAPLDPLALFFERACERVLAGLIGTAGLPAHLAMEAQALGLQNVLTADANWAQSGQVAQALQLAYILHLGRDLTAQGAAAPPY